MGMEKFFNIKCRASGLVPDAVVLVATVRALKAHGGGPAVTPGKPLPQVYREENIELLKQGLSNLEAHLGIVRRFGVPAVVAVAGGFPTDTEAELDLIVSAALQAGAAGAVVSHHWAHGGEGAAELARAVEAAAALPNNFRLLYRDEAGLADKIETIAREVYGADGVDFGKGVLADLEQFEKNGSGTLPICMAKTQYSLSHDPALRGAPKGWRLPVREVRLNAGAGFVCPLCGDITTMPGLPSRPAFMDVDIDDDGTVRGLF
jgi:formyltetrahydrofolate synthetase